MPNLSIALCFLPKKRGTRIKIVQTAFLMLFSPLFSQASGIGDVVINEIAWMGTKANSADEWIELYNNTDQIISLKGWGLYEAGGTTLIEPLSGTINAFSYYLIERTDDSTISDIGASQEPGPWGGFGLNNAGEHLVLLDQNSAVIDEVSSWFAGESSPNYRTMERKNPQKTGIDSDNWATNDGSTINGLDAAGNPINGTPMARNSATIMLSDPTPIPPPTPLQDTAPEPTPPSSSSQTPSPLPPPLPPQAPKPTTTPSQIPSPPIVAYPSGVIFSEILPSPKGPDETDEWIEIFNRNDFEVDLSGWQITDTVGAVAKYIFPKTTKIGPEQFLVLLRPQTKITLNNSEDGLKLFNPAGDAADAVNYKNAPKDNSYNLLEGGWEWSSVLTPGDANASPIPEGAISASEGDFNPQDDREKRLASAGSQIPKNKSSFLIIIFALFLSAVSGFSILLFKKVATK